MKSTAWMDEAKWIWLDHYDDNSPEAKIVLFRKSFQLARRPSWPCILKVSADTRYRFFVNGTSVSFGPCKSYTDRWFYESIDIAPYLKAGSNTLSARVLRFSSAHPGSFSLARGPYPGLIVHCVVENQNLHTDATWEARPDTSVEMISRSEWNYALGPPFIVLNERVNAQNVELGWHTSAEKLWSKAKIMTSKSMMLPVLEPWKLAERSIPQLPEVEKLFDGAVTCTGSVDISNWTEFVQGLSSLQIPANESVTVELESLELTTGFLCLKFIAGAGAKIRALCAESYEQPHERPGPGVKRQKTDRTDHVNGKLYGPSDYYTAREGFNVFEPFWFRAFRYVQLEISATSQPLTLHSLCYRETHYPLEIKTTIKATPDLDQMWKISLNTLRNCMHETYEDCPYYEQNQFIMDSRLQMLFTYQLSRDDRLARKTMQEFYASRTEDGLLQAQFPNPGRCVNIPQFSLFWILMIHDHMQYFGDKKLVKQYLGAVDGILEHFDSRINDNGLVGQFDPEMWPFVDWVKEWFRGPSIHTMCFPPAYADGAATYNSLIYAFALQHAADLCEFVGRSDTANEYRGRAKDLNAAVNQFCFNGNLYVDGPNSKSLSQHSQIFAILSGAIEGPAATALMKKAIEDTSLPQCSYAMTFYVLRAAKKTGLYYEKFPQLIIPWQKMMANNLTTWAEDDINFRSDCHGWSSSPIYETVAQLFGLSPASPGYQTLRLEPLVDLLADEAEGTFITAGGSVKLTWVKGKGLEVQTDYDTAMEILVNESTQVHQVKKNEVIRLLWNQSLRSILNGD